MAKARFHTPRTPSRATRSGEVARIAKALGIDPMQWQQEGWDVSLEVDANGKPYYRNVTWTIPRQSGKTVGTLPVLLHRAIMWGSPQHLAYGAADGNAAKKKLFDDLLPMVLASPLSASIEKVRRQNGSEAVFFKNGSQLDVFGSSKSSGHSATLDFVLMDETWSDRDFRRDAALIPAMATRPDAQVWNISTAGEPWSVYLRSKVEAGRAAVIADERTGICFVEYGAEDDDNLSTDEPFYRFHPALGNTIDISVIRDARRSMDPREFERAFANRWRGGKSILIPDEVWRKVLRPVELAKPLVLGLDTNNDRTFTSVAACDTQGNAELVRYGAGTSWVIEYVVATAKKLSAPVALDSRSQAASFADEFSRNGVKVLKLSSDDMANACGSFYDAVADERISIRNSEQADVLTAAVGNAAKRPLGNRFAWAPAKKSADISPLIAVTCAVWAAPKASKRQVRFSL